MPIYAYKCATCGHAQDVLQKISDEPLTVCPSCGAATFTKQVTAAGFQLKGSGWYVTDFRDGGKKESSKNDSSKESGTSTEAKAESKDSTTATPAPAANSPSPAPAAASAPSPTASSPPPSTSS